MTNTEKDIMIHAINTYFTHEGFDTITTLPAHGIVGLAYTEYEFDDDTLHEIQVNLDINNMCISSYVDGCCVDKEYYDKWGYESLAYSVGSASFGDIIRAAVDYGYNFYCVEG